MQGANGRSRAVETARIHIEVWTARFHLTDHPRELLTTPSPLPASRRDVAYALQRIIVRTGNL
jgi:hypothetical protein